MIGVDIVRIDRISRASFKFTKFKEKFLSTNELILAKNDSSTAGLWAAKEAISKALGCGIGAELGFLDIEIYKDKKGSPKVKFSQDILDKFNIKEIDISISHDGGFAIAVAVVRI